MPTTQTESETAKPFKWRVFQHYLTKARVTKKKNQRGGQPFSRGHLYQILSNPVYIGKTKHKGEVFDGQHEPIMTLELWDNVQSGLKDNAPKRRRSINIASNSLLTGIIYDGDGDRLTPVHSKKPNGRRYRYYVSARLFKGESDDGTALRLPADQIEGHVIRKLTALLSDTARLTESVDQDLTPLQITELQTQAKRLVERLGADTHELRRTTLIDLLKQIKISSAELTFELRKTALCLKSTHNNSGTANNTAEEEILTLTYPLQMKRRGVETKLIIGGVALGQPDPELIKLIAQSKDWYEGLKTGRLKSIKEIGATEKMDNGDVSRTLSLAFLAPSIVSDIIKGQHPVDLTPRDLRRKASRLPLDWTEQRAFLGMTA